MSRFSRARFLWSTALLFAWLTAVGSAAAGPFTNLVVFGDSLSDIGNVQQSFLTNTPGPYYWNGRFSNGPNYAETLTTGLGLPALNRSTATGGNDFAYGGAKTSGTSFPTSLVVKDIDDQVDSFLSNRTANASTLYVVLVGANDLIDGQTNMSVPIGSLSTSMNRLITAGARQFLVLNLPPLGNTPRYRTTQQSLFNTRSQQYNTALSTMLDGLHTSNPSTTINRFDLSTLFNQAVANPLKYGLTNTTDSAAPGLEPGDTSYDTSQLVPNPNQHLFWDDLHPTAAVHLILGHRLLDMFFPPGDYSRNVTSDAADYVAFRKGLGTTYVPIDYDIWRAHYGQTTPGGSASGTDILATTVPEPGGILAVVAACSLLYSRARRSR